MSLCYTSFRRPQQITMSNDTLQITESYTYDALYNRVQSTLRLIDLQTGRMTMRTSFSLGGCYDNDGVAERLWLGGGYYGAPVVLEVTDTMRYRYVMRDHLGSITHVYTAEPIPTLLQELSYDAWGRLRNPDTHEAYASDSVPTPILGRGYTGHRHIAGIGLIDMNARLYDPMLGRFLSPDPHIQSPDCPQNYNRYTYCLNNPLRYTDPTGMIKIKIGFDLNFSSGILGFGIGSLDANIAPLGANEIGIGVFIEFDTDNLGFNIGASWTKTSYMQLYEFTLDSYGYKFSEESEYEIGGDLNGEYEIGDYFPNDYETSGGFIYRNFDFSPKYFNFNLGKEFNLLILGIGSGLSINITP